MAQGVDVLQILASGRHPPRVVMLTWLRTMLHSLTVLAMLTWLRMMLHSLTVLAMLTWLVVNGPDAILETQGAITCLL
jgi:hypothetical protein